MQDLDERFLHFPLACRDYLRSRKWDEVDRIYKLQLARPAGWVGADYIEANENPGKQNLLMHLRIYRKEAKDSRLWLKHLDDGTDRTNTQLQQETEEIKRFLSAIILKTTTTTSQKRNLTSEA